MSQGARVFTYGAIVKRASHTKFQTIMTGLHVHVTNTGRCATRKCARCTLPYLCYCSSMTKAQISSSKMGISEIAAKQSLTNIDLINGSDKLINYCHEPFNPTKGK